MVRREEGNVLVPSGELDLATAILRSALKACAGHGGVTVDLASLQFLDSAADRGDRGRRAAAPSAGSLLLRCPSGPVQRVLDLMQIERVPGVTVQCSGTA